MSDIFDDKFQKISEEKTINSTMTINSLQSSLESKFFLEQLSTKPHLVLFSGQGTPWDGALKDLLANNQIREQLQAYDLQVQKLLQPVTHELLATAGRNPSVLASLDSSKTEAVVSVPGIALTQLGALLEFVSLGYELDQFAKKGVSPLALGHSQGVIAEKIYEQILHHGLGSKSRESISEILAISYLIGAAGTRIGKAKGIIISRDKTPMVSIKGANLAQVKELIERVKAKKLKELKQLKKDSSLSSKDVVSITIAVQNNHDDFVLSGLPEDLEAFVVEANAEHLKQKKQREDKERGGRVFTPILEFLQVSIPFHCDLMQNAVDLVQKWAKLCNFEENLAKCLAERVLTLRVDWRESVTAALAGLKLDDTWILDFGPGKVAAKLSREVLIGKGLGFLDASSTKARQSLATATVTPKRTDDWSKYAPRIVETPAGLKVQTAFSRLTGCPPVLLSGMTPTTVEADIVAAAANAGYWTELAGGGQVSSPVLDRNVGRLMELLEEGHTAKFNAMFMDRYLWNLQFGNQRAVPKKRAQGAPIDGVVISAGVPEFDEAIELIESLHSDGFPYVAFKPGTVDQIRQVVKIAREIAPKRILIQIEGGEAGGHHSWDSLEDLLLDAYAEIRSTDNLILLVGGGIGSPKRAADFITGKWALRHQYPLMPVDGIMVGTAALCAKEAHTSPQVKELLVNTPGISPEVAYSQPEDPFAVPGWVGSGKPVGGVNSGLSHLRADIYEVENASARCGRLIVEIMADPKQLKNRRDEVIAALNTTSKPYFGELTEMTYLEWLRRFAKLCYPWRDDTYSARFLGLLQRIEARLNPKEYGPITSLFPNVEAVLEPEAAIELLRQTYPSCETTRVSLADSTWFPTLIRSYPKPLPFVPVIDGDLLRWWGQDQLWQAEDARYSADSVRAIPGPISVSGITKIDEPVADILGRFEEQVTADVAELEAETVKQITENLDKNYENVTNNRQNITKVVSLLAGAQTYEEFIRKSPHIYWIGHVTTNPAYGTDQSDENYELVHIGEEGKYQQFDLIVHLDTFWDEQDGAKTQAGLNPSDHANSHSNHVVRQIVVPLNVETVPSGAMPVVDVSRISEHVYQMLAATAGVGEVLENGAMVANRSITGDVIEAMPTIIEADDKEHYPFGYAKSSYTLAENLFYDYESVTGACLPQEMTTRYPVPDALVGPAWPAIYAALGSVYVGEVPIIEGLLNAVHLDHLVKLNLEREKLLQLKGETILLKSWAENYLDSTSGRIVVINVIHSLADGTVIAEETERFAIRGRVFSEELAPDASPYGAATVDRVDTVRRVLRKLTVVAPKDMTAFARTSGDFNPIHTSYRAARISGLKAPLVHGMWLSATTQHAVQAILADGSQYEISGWTYSMYGMVQLEDEVEITIERVGYLREGGLILEATCRIDGQVVSKASVLTRVKTTAYVFPGQGIQQKGMALDEIAKSPAADDTWKRADKLTREKLGFSILALVRDNPTELTANGVTYRHPEGLLNLTQFTQVALATVAYAQTARLIEAGRMVWPSYYAGHSLGEYNALAACAGSFPLETVLELVFHRGSTMHQLIERDEQGRSNYQMGALRPNQFGVGDEEVTAYVEEVSKTSGEFLQIVNYNLAGNQYAVAGTIAGIKALMADSSRRAKEYGGKPPFMLIPGIDVPFHSRVLAKGVDDFRLKLDELLPQKIDFSRLVGLYIPNLVATPFQISKEFAQIILDTVPSQALGEIVNDEQKWNSYAKDEQKLGRLLLIELLAWQFASPVRWIETQAALFTKQQNGGLGVEQVVEIGLGNAPTLANLATRTLKLPQFADNSIEVYNLGRDETRVYLTDSDPSFVLENSKKNQTNNQNNHAKVEETTTNSEQTPTNVENNSTDASSAEANPKPAETKPKAPVTPAAAPVSASSAPAISFDASSAIEVLLAYSSKIRLDQIAKDDTTDTLTSGVSSRRNQLLMDISSELQVASVEGAAEANVETLLQLVNKSAPHYKPFGPVLDSIIREQIRNHFGTAQVTISQIEQRVCGYWKLEQSWVALVLANLLLETRQGSSTRGGELSTLGFTGVSSSDKAYEFVDALIQHLASQRGVSLTLTSGEATGAAVVDSAALEAYADKVTGADGILAKTARFILSGLNLDLHQRADLDTSSDQKVVEAVSAELGADWVKLVEPKFDEARAILFDDRWASAREDLARIYHEDRLDLADSNFCGAGAEVQAQASWYLHQLQQQLPTSNSPQLISEKISIFERIITDSSKKIEKNRQKSKISPNLSSVSDSVANQENLDYTEFSDDIAIVTGVSDRSIAAKVCERLLRGGATVIATSHSFRPQTVTWARESYRKHAAFGAKLWLVPANLTSYRDVDRFCEWVGSLQRKVSGISSTVLKPAYIPTLFFPFAAPPVHGTMEDAGSLFETQSRLMLWSVERSITKFAVLGADTAIQHRLHVVLPGSPNRGLFGGDGAYGEVKAAFDALVARAKSEPWSKRVTFAHPLIGWVKSTGLMGGNDPLVELVEEQGLKVWTTDEMAKELLRLCTPTARTAAVTAPLRADLTGGLGTNSIDIRALRKKARQNLESESKLEPTSADSISSKPTVAALPNIRVPSQPVVDLDQWKALTASPKDLIVIVSVGEIGPWGSGRTRHEAELGLHRDGSVELTPAGILELCWNMGLLEWSNTPSPGWYDVNGELVPEEEIAGRYRDEVIANCGIRPFNDGMGSDYLDGTNTEMTQIYLDQPLSFTVADKASAQKYQKQDPEHTSISFDEASGEYLVVREAGSLVYVPRRATMTRTVGGELPTGFDPVKWGIPPSMVENIDRIALWNIVATVDAYLSAGFTPAEILSFIHPSQVASTQGTGFGGMSSMRKLYLDRFLTKQVPNDILQEALPNVVAAHVMQAYIGGYGAMVQPVSACATAAVSLEEAVDKITVGKADFVVAGAIDDISVESVIGFGNMNAIANSEVMYAKGISSRFFSRANDRRREGFLESQGGGTILVTRGDLALEHGLPVAAVIGYVRSFSDGIHTSIPAPGLGALAAGHGGPDAKLVQALAQLGVSPDDIQVVSKHDTSTNANDPNESELHNTLAYSIGRAKGNPLYVISQKTLTGHSKGGACVFQVNGLVQLFQNGIIPGNISLDCVDPVLRRDDLMVWLTSPLTVGTVKAALATSLGFGHVSALVALVSPGAFEAAVERAAGKLELNTWRNRANSRLARGYQHLQAGMMGLDTLFEPVTARRFQENTPTYDAHEVEKQMLLDPKARLDSSGVYLLRES